MINTLYLPELREMLAAQDREGLKVFCETLHPSQTAPFMEGLTADEQWQVLRETDLDHRTDVFSYLDWNRQIEILATQPPAEVAEVVAHLPADDRVDLLDEVPNDVVEHLLSLLPPAERRDILRLRQYPTGTAGAMMTTDVVRLTETTSIRDALNELSNSAHALEMVYYLYILDQDGYLRGVVSAREILSAMRLPNRPLSEIMNTDVIAARVTDDQEKVAELVAKLDLLAVPIVDQSGRFLGIVTHDDVIDVVLDEATADAHQMAAVQPLEAPYLRTGLFDLAKKRGIWLVILFFCSLTTAFTLQHLESELLPWMVAFVPLVISTGGNSGGQAATLIITALARGELSLRDWTTVVARELRTGLMLGGTLFAVGLVTMWLFPQVAALGWMAVLVVPITLNIIVMAGTLTGAILPLICNRMGWDPAIMSNPLVAGIMDVMGIIIYVKVATMIMPAVI
ncbi:MAG: magnesium transporter [Planctomycetaceae bacterium]|nr:magnesium transporter [Planctomycetaceae bacterium]